MSVLNTLLEKILNLFPQLITVSPEEAGVRITLGKRISDCGPGWYIIWPVIQELIVLVTTPSVTEVARVDARTKDGTSVTVGIALLYRVSNARSAILNVDKFEDMLNAIGPDAARKCIEASTDEELSSIENVRKTILDEARASCRGWGLKIDRVMIPSFTSCKTIRIIGDEKLVPEESE
jgi:regulator of protease activity HflC (stomatin/prohibitin superfamily)